MISPSAFMTQIFQIENYTGRTPHGETFDPEYTVKHCRLELFKTMQQKLAVSSKGKEIIVKGRVFLPATKATATLVVESKITVDGETYKLRTKTKERGFGVSHYEGYVD